MDLCQVFLSLSFARSLHRWWYVSDGSCGVLTLWGSLNESFVCVGCCVHVYGVFVDVAVVLDAGVGLMFVRR